MTNWSELIKNWGYFGIALSALLSAIVWLGKRAVDRWIDHDLDQHKNRLEMQLEKLKADLVIAGKESEIRFNKLHEKRAEIIAELYCQINDAEIAVEMYYRRFKIREDGKLTDEIVEKARSETVRKCTAAFEFFRRNELYFSEKLAFKIAGLISLIQGTGLLPPGLLPVGSNGDQLLNDWRQKEAEIRDVKKEIASEFRILLGVYT